MGRSRLRGLFALLLCACGAPASPVRHDEPSASEASPGSQPAIVLDDNQPASADSPTSSAQIAVRSSRARERAPEPGSAPAYHEPVEGYCGSDPEPHELVPVVPQIPAVPVVSDLPDVCDEH